MVGIAKDPFVFKKLFSREWISSVTAGLGFLLASFIINHYAFVYARAYSIRPTTVYVGDALLDNLPVFDLNLVIVKGMLFAVVAMIAYVLSQPRVIPFYLKTLALFIAVRALFMSLTHIGIHPDQIGPGLGIFDSLYVYLNFQTGLFFSGHTGMPFLLGLMFWKKKAIRYICFAISIIFAISVLFAHVHYSIDVFAAPFIAYGIFIVSSKYLFKREYALLNATVES